MHNLETPFDKAVTYLPLVGTGLIAAYQGWKEHKRKKKQGFLKGTLEGVKNSLPLWAAAGAILGMRSYHPSSGMTIPVWTLGSAVGGLIAGAVASPFIALPGYTVGRLVGEIKSKLTSDFRKE